MDRAAVFQIAAHHHGEPLERAFFLAQRVQIAQSLGWMLVAAIASVDHRHVGMFRHRLHRAIPIVAHDEYIGVARNNLGGIGDRFAFGG